MQIKASQTNGSAASTNSESKNSLLKKTLKNSHTPPPLKKKKKKARTYANHMGRPSEVENTEIRICTEKSHPCWYEIEWYDN